MNSFQPVLPTLTVSFYICVCVCILDVILTCIIMDILCIML